MALQRDKIVNNAEKLVAKGKVEAAIREYQRLLDDNPNDVNTLNRIGDLWVRVGRSDEAVKVFRTIADHYSRDGFFLKAIAIFKKINKLDPSRLEVYAKLAELYAKQGLAMEAKGQYLVLAEYYLKHGESENALDIYKKISELDPHSINVHIKLADLSAQTGQKEEALEQYRQVGQLLLKRGMSTEAIQVYRKAMRIDPANLDLAESLVDALVADQDYDAAKEIIDAAVETTGATPRLIVLQATVHLARQDLVRAKAILERGLSRHPRDFALREKLAEIHLRQNEPERALELISPILSASLEEGEGQRAVDTLSGLLAAAPEHPGMLERLAECYEHLQQSENAVATRNRLADALVARGDFSAAAEALNRLLLLQPDNRQNREKLQFVLQQLGESPELELQTASDEPSRISHEPEPAADEASAQADDFSIEIDKAEEVSQETFSLTSVEESGELPEFEIEIEEPDREFEFTLPEAESGGDDHPEAPAAAVAPHERTEQEQRELEFIAEHLTEAEVFAKYGLAEKAVENLEEVIDRFPDHLPAWERLLNVVVNEGMAGRVTDIAPRYLQMLRDFGESDTADSVQRDLENRGYRIPRQTASGGLTSEPPEHAVPQLPAETLATEEREDEREKATWGGEEEQEAILQFVEEEDESATGTEQLRDAPTIEHEAEESVTFFDASPSGEEAPDEFFQPEQSDSEVLQVNASSEEPLPDELATTPEPSAEVSPVEGPSPSEIPTEPADALAASSPRGEQRPGTSAFSGVGPSADDLGELDFYIEQELFDEARHKLQLLSERFGDHSEIRSRRENLETAAREAVNRPDEPAPEEISPLLGRAAEADDSAAESALFAAEDDFFDLAAELEDELADEELDEPSVEEEEQSLEQIFREFKKGVEQQLDSEDYETHYNLGIAYKEMGLIDEAIGEFQLASKDPSRAIDGCSMLGLCFLEKGMPQLAIKWYNKGLEMPDIKEDEQLGLLYDLGMAYLEVGDTANAQKSFMEVYGINSNYRDVVVRMKELQDVNKPN